MKKVGEHGLSHSTNEVMCSLEVLTAFGDFIIYS